MQEKELLEGAADAGVARLPQRDVHHCAGNGAAVHQRFCLTDDLRCDS